ncbi:MAG TPA: hypothetical protein VGX23_02720 [Actinocrinis sp.]|nr:hypothetical protein [Actinocrinis sp.]
MINPFEVSAPSKISDLYVPRDGDGRLATAEIWRRVPAFQLLGRELQIVLEERQQPHLDPDFDTGRDARRGLRLAELRPDHRLLVGQGQVERVHDGARLRQEAAHLLGRGPVAEPTAYDHREQRPQQPVGLVEAYVLVTAPYGLPQNSTFTLTLWASDGTTTQTETVPIVIKAICGHY